MYLLILPSLSPTSKQYLTCLAHLILEAIVRTDTTTAGVDYNSSCVVFEGDKLTVIRICCFQNSTRNLNGIKEAILPL
jgi:hypothetical protein